MSFSTFTFMAAPSAKNKRARAPSPSAIPPDSAGSDGGDSERERPAPVVWIVDADHWPRAYLRAELIERGYDAVGFVTLRAALARLATLRFRRAGRPELIVVDLHELAVDDPLLAGLRRAGAPVLGVADAAAAADPLVRGFPWAALLRRPLTIGDIADVVEERLKRPDS
jgi:hypothetical protein